MPVIAPIIEAGAAVAEGGAVAGAGTAAAEGGSAAAGEGLLSRIAKMGPGANGLREGFKAIKGSGGTDFSGLAQSRFGNLNPNLQGNQFHAPGASAPPRGATMVRPNVPPIRHVGGRAAF